MKVTLGVRELDMLMDGLLALEGNWEDLDKPPTSEDQRRYAVLFAKLMTAYHAQRSAA